MECVDRYSTPVCRPCRMRGKSHRIGLSRDRSPHMAAPASTSRQRGRRTGFQALATATPLRKWLQQLSRLQQSLGFRLLSEEPPGDPESEGLVYFEGI